MSYTPWSTQGTQLKLTISSTPTLVPGVESIDISGGQKKTIEVTALSDTAAVFVTGLPDLGTLGFTLFWDPANTVHQALYTAYTTPNSVSAFTITCSDAGTADITFNASVNGWDWPLGKDQGAQVKVSAKITGSVTVTP